MRAAKLFIIAALPLLLMGAGPATDPALALYEKGD
jgi:hypothetical protein